MEPAPTGATGFHGALLSPGFCASQVAALFGSAGGTFLKLRCEHRRPAGVPTCTTVISSIRPAREPLTMTSGSVKRLWRLCRTFFAVFWGRALVENSYGTPACLAKIVPRGQMAMSTIPADQQGDDSANNMLWKHISLFPLKLATRRKWPPRLLQPPPYLSRLW